MVYRYGILCKLREKPVIARDYRIIPSKIVGDMNEIKQEQNVFTMYSEILCELFCMIFLYVTVS